MRKPKRSKTYGLFKSCQHLSWDKCECPWLGRYRDVRYVNLGEWAGIVTPGKTRAIEILTEVKTAIKGGTFRKEGKTFQGATGITFGKLCSLYRTHLIDRGVPNVKTSGIHGMLTIFETHFGSYPLASLTPILIEEWMKERAKGDKRRPKWGNATWNRYRAFGSGMFNWALKPKQALVSKNPFLEIDKKLETTSKPPRLDDGGVTEDQLFAAVALAYPPVPEHPKLHALHTRKRREMERRLIGALDTGMRRGELANVRVSDVNYQSWEITLPTSKGRTKTGGAAEKVFAMTPRLQKVLEERRFLKAPNDYVFGHEDGSYQAAWKKAWKHVFREAKLKGFVWHSLRHEFCSQMAELTDNIVEVKELARHRNLSTTERYMKAKEERLKDLLRRKVRA
jgi:integrase